MIVDYGFKVTKKGEKKSFVRGELRVFGMIFFKSSMYRAVV